MTISWYGEACFLLESGGIRVLIEPPQKESGLNTPRLKSDILIYSQRKTKDRGLGTTEETFVIDSPGEYEIRGVNIAGVFDDENIIYVIDMDNIKMAHLGFLKKEPSNEKLELIGNPDIVFVPVGALPALPGRQAGGRQSLEDRMFGAEEAMKLINKMEPKIAIPMLYDIKGLKTKRASIQNFIKESEAKDAPVPKLTVKKKDLVEEETNIVIIEKI